LTFYILKRIKYCIRLWSGNGYHIYQPLEAFPLEQEQMFASKSAEPSKEFLQFAEQYLTNYKSDPSHHPSFKSCMIRIPGSHNYKLVQKNNHFANESTKVKIKQRWDGVRPKFNLLLYHFNIWLADKRNKEIDELQRMNKDNRKRRYNNNYYNNSRSGSIDWIEMLLRTPISDYRKFASYWILSRCLINIRHVNPDEAYAIMKEWSLNCNELEQLSPSIRDFDRRIRNDIREAVKSKKAPIGKELLKDMNKELYAKLFSTDD
jgi:Primase X